jgi:hypothetical protein
MLEGMDLMDGHVGSPTRDPTKAEPELVEKIAEFTIINQSKGKSGSYAHAAHMRMQNHSKSKSLLHLTSLKQSRRKQQFLIATIIEIEQ